MRLSFESDEQNISHFMYLWPSLHKHSAQFLSIQWVVAHLSLVAFAHRCEDSPDLIIIKLGGLGVDGSHGTTDWL